MVIGRGNNKKGNAKEVILVVGGTGLGLSKLNLKLTLETWSKRQWWPQRWLDGVSMRLIRPAPQHADTATIPTSPPGLAAH